MSDSGKKSRTDFENAALFFHEHPSPGKLEIAATKPLGNQRDLALAYSPGVATPCLEIASEPASASKYTSRGNLVAVVSNGTAVLGLGNIGPLASKPVMEGKAVLFKKFAGIDVFDIEVDQNDPEKFADVVAALEPTFGGINLEDIKGPDCFAIEEDLRKRMNIPVFHDDQHGTAIIVGAAVTNALNLVGKDIRNVKIVASGAGAAALACLNLLVTLGAQLDNIWVTDIDGVVYEGRDSGMDPWKAKFARKTDLRTLDDVIDGADIFLGLSASGVLKPEMVAKMAQKPLIMALANPNPEIMPQDAKAVRDDVLMCTGRSDFPNQVNNVLCFPYIFRGALDVGATAINEEMKAAAVDAIASLAREEVSEVAAQALSGETPVYGPDYLIPTPFDPRLILRVAPAVAQAAMDTGVATRPIENFETYLDQLNRFVFRSGLIMKPVFAAAKQDPKRIIYADGEDERVLRAAQVLIEEKIAFPILVGRPRVIETRALRFGLKIRPNQDFEVINPESDRRYRDYADHYFSKVGRLGVTPDTARAAVRNNSTVIACVAVDRGDADAMICGLEGPFAHHLENVRAIIGLSDGVKDMSTLSLLITQRGGFFLADTYVTYDPGAEEIAETTIMAVEQIRQFGITPRVALVSHSNFGTRNNPSSEKMRQALKMLWEQVPDLEVDGEMHGDAAITEALRRRVMPDSKLTGAANLFVFPNLDAANISLNLVKGITDALHVGPILLGTRKIAHIATPSITSRGIVNMSALATVEAANLQK